MSERVVGKKKFSIIYSIEFIKFKLYITIKFHYPTTPSLFECYGGLKTGYEYIVVALAAALAGIGTGLVTVPIVSALLLSITLIWW